MATANNTLSSVPAPSHVSINQDSYNEAQLRRTEVSALMDILSITSDKNCLFEPREGTVFALASLAERLLEEMDELLQPVV